MLLDSEKWFLTVGRVLDSGMCFFTSYWIFFLPHPALKHWWIIAVKFIKDRFIRCFKGIDPSLRSLNLLPIGHNELD